MKTVHVATLIAATGCGPPAHQPVGSAKNGGTDSGSGVAEADTGTPNAGDDRDDTDPGAESDEVAHRAVFVVHLEPGAVPVEPATSLPSTVRAEQYLEDLVDLIVLADHADHQLTIMLSPQWAAHIASEDCVVPAAADALTSSSADFDSCLALAHGIEARGHELALHHHPLSGGSTWDGYTAEEVWTADRDGDGTDETYFADGGGPSGPDPWYLGTVDAMVEAVAGITSSGIIRTATTEEFHPMLTFSMAGGPSAYSSLESPGDLVGEPCATAYGDHWVWELRMRLFTSATAQASLLSTELPAALDDLTSEAPAPKALGFVTHAINVDETGLSGYEELFSQLTANGMDLEPVSEVMARFSSTDADASAAPEESRCTVVDSAREEVR